MVFTAYWTFPANLGAYTCVYECIIWRYSSSSSSSSRRTCGRSVCLRPSEEVCIGLSPRICSLCRLRIYLPFSLAIFSSLVHFLRMSGDMLSCKDATSAHRAETFRPPRRTNLSDVHCYDERRNFPVGMDNIFRENIGNFIRERRRDKFPPSCIAERNGFRFLPTSENWFSIPFSCANRFIASLFVSVYS